MGLRQTGIRIATGKSRKVRKESGQTTVESKPNVGSRAGRHGCFDIGGRDNGKVRRVPLNVTLVVSPEHFPESSSRPPQPLLASQPVSLDGIRSSVLKRSLNLVT